MTSRWIFINEFKIVTFNLVLKQGYSIQEAAKTINVSPTALRWSKQFEAEISGITPRVVMPDTPEQVEFRSSKPVFKRLIGKMRLPLCASINR